MASFINSYLCSLINGTLILDKSIIEFSSRMKALSLNSQGEFRLLLLKNPLMLTVER